MPVTPAWRWPAVDLLRGVAIVAMIAYHFCFDLAWNGWLVADFGNDWRWVWFRIPILGSFLFIAGASLALARVQRQPAARFWRHTATVGAAAAAVTLGSYLMFPASYIYFGVLHAIALMSIVARPLLGLGIWVALPGLAIVLLGVTLRHPFFDQPLLHWIGLMTFKPQTEDYVPFFPWFGIMLIGAGAAAWTAGHPRWPARLAAWRQPAGLNWVSWLGRHSLVVYLVHQPVLLGAMLLVRQLG